MPTFPFNETIPDAPNNPSADQPLMKQNNLSTDRILNEDHFTFEEGNNDGYHRQTRMVAQAGIPAPTQPGMGTLYVKTFENGYGPIGTLFYTPDNSGKEYVMTRALDKPLFAAGPTGWTFLPGLLMLQYGTVTTPATGTVPVVFPVQFTSGVYAVIQTVQQTNAAATFNVRIASYENLLSTGFNYVISDASGAGKAATGSWIAIGV